MPNENRLNLFGSMYERHKDGTANCWKIPGGWVRHSVNGSWFVNIFGITATADHPETAIRKVFRRAHATVESYK